MFSCEKSRTAKVYRIHVTSRISANLFEWNTIELCIFFSIKLRNIPENLCTFNLAFGRRIWSPVYCDRLFKLRE